MKSYMVVYALVISAAFPAVAQAPGRVFTMSAAERDALQLYVIRIEQVNEMLAKSLAVCMSVNRI